MSAWDDIAQGLSDIGEQIRSGDSSWWESLKSGASNLFHGATGGWYDAYQGQVAEAQGEAMRLNTEGGAINDQDPMAILAAPISEAVSTTFVKGMGLPQLLYIVRLFGIMSAVIVIVVSLLTLAVVNYPKTLMQTKTRIVTAALTIVIISLILIFADITLSILYDSFLS